LDAERYLREVAPHLATLSEEEKTELLDDLAQHLSEIAAEDGPPLHERLGPPAAYAAELLASAGIAAQGRARPHRLTLVLAAVDGAKRSAVGRELVRLTPVLRPAWWVGRAYLAVLLLTNTVVRDRLSPGIPVPRLAGNPALGMLGVALAIAASVRLGQRQLPRVGRLAIIAGNAVLVVFALSLLGGSSRGLDSNPPDQLTAYRSCLSNGEGQSITNLYAYDTDGRLLDPVLLYDQSGRPIDLCPDYGDQGRGLAAEFPRDANGAPVVNAFPRRQSTSAGPSRADAPRPDGSPFRPALPRIEATVPVAPPAVVVPRLATPTTTTASTTTTSVAPIVPAG